MCNIYSFIILFYKVVVLGTVGVVAYQSGKQHSLVSQTPESIQQDLVSEAQNQEILAPVSTPTQQNTSKPTITTPPTPPRPVTTEPRGSQVACNGIAVTSPIPNQTISAPLTLSGVINPNGPANPGPWRAYAGEGASVRVFDGNNQLLATSVVMVGQNWMNTNPKPFSGTIPAFLSQPTTSTGMVVFTEQAQADPSEMGRPVSSCIIPVTF
jgi:hypothetical protein